MAPTIAERAARGEALHAPDLPRREQGELLVWAREQNMGYKEIKTKYGFEQTTDTMRGWHMSLVRDRPPKVPTFTDEDDRLLQNAVQLYATGPLNEQRSFKGVWKQAKAYIRKNGGTTSAGEAKLRERWQKLNGRQVPPSTHKTRSTARARGARASTQNASATQAASIAQAVSNTPAEPIVTFAFSFPSITGQNQPTASAQPATGMEWEYDSLSEGEKREVLGYDEEEQEKDDQEEPAEEEADGDMEWGEYDPLSENEKREVLGSDYASEDSSDNGSSDEEQQKQQEEQEAQAEEEAEWGEYPGLSEGEMDEALRSDSSDEDYSGEEADGENDSDYEEN